LIRGVGAARSAWAKPRVTASSPNRLATESSARFCREAGKLKLTHYPSAQLVSPFGESVIFHERLPTAWTGAVRTGPLYKWHFGD